MNWSAKVFTAAVTMVLALSPPASGQGITSALGGAVEVCLRDGIANNDIAKNWLRRPVEQGGDGERHFGVKVRCTGHTAEQLWIQAGRVDVPEAPFKSDQNNRGIIRYLGGSLSYCLHLTEQANGDPSNVFICFLGIDLDPEMVTAL